MLKTDLSWANFNIIVLDHKNGQNVCLLMNGGGILTFSSQTNNYVCQSPHKHICLSVDIQTYLFAKLWLENDLWQL